jgi:heme a synthase
VLAYDDVVNGDRPHASAAMIRRLALASVAVNALLVVTGGAVRLTGSGLGCPTWPKCTDDSYTNTPAYGFHGYIEFGNRLLFFVIGFVVVAVFVAALLGRPRRRSLVWLAVINGATIPAQAVMGGITVLTKLNPWTVAAHFMLTVAIIAVSFWLWWRSREGDEPATGTVAKPLRGLALLITAVALAVLTIGTITTGSGPHAGDQHAHRTGLDPGMVAQLHADSVMLLIGLSAAAWFALRATGAPERIHRAALALIAVELGQGVIGFVQYFTHLPVLLVGIHMAGAATVWLCALRLLFLTRDRGPVPAPEPVPAAEPAEPELAAEPAEPELAGHGRSRPGAASTG